MQKIVLAVLMVLLFSVRSFSAVEVDGIGPYAVDTTEYKFEAKIDPSVTDKIATEIWAVIYHPKVLKKSHPLLIFLHGNHSSCGFGENPRVDNNWDYATTGECPPTHKVVLQHKGYAYMAERLASWGYIVVSINTNRGLTFGPGIENDPMYNEAHGNMVLRHLQLLTDWNKSGAQSSIGLDLTNKIDFSNVGFLGHSVGGEGVRTAFDLYHQKDSAWKKRISPNLKIKAVIELGGTDNKFPRLYDVQNTAWLGIVAMCDGNVPSVTSMQPFARMTSSAPKVIFGILGANHQFFNSEWQVSESFACLNQEPLWNKPGGEELQRSLTRYAVMSHFRAYVGKNANREFATAFDPKNPLPKEISSQAEILRMFEPQISSSDVLWEVAPSLPNPNVLSNNLHLRLQDLLSNIEEEEGEKPHTPWKTYKARWYSSGEEVYLQVNIDSKGDSKDLSKSNFINFSIAPTANTLNTIPYDFSIRLVNMNGKLSKEISLSTYLQVTKAVGGPYRGVETVLQTVRIPINDFSFDLKNIRGIRFIFNKTTMGETHITAIRASKL